ncbi:MAG: hypothetical protein ACRD0N_06425, partial [Acidimicrobiales bacterium]
MSISRRRPRGSTRRAELGAQRRAGLAQLGPQIGVLVAQVDDPAVQGLDGQLDGGLVAGDGMGAGRWGGRHGGRGRSGGRC